MACGTPPPLADGLRVELERDATRGEFKWIVFTDGKRGSVGKLLAELKPPGAREGFVKSISLRPNFRGKGTGLVLLEQCKAFFRDELGCLAVALEAEEDMDRFGKLVALYEKAGFRVVGDPASFKLLYHDEETLRVVPMRCGLAASAGGAAEGQPSGRFSRAFAAAMVDECRRATRGNLTVWEALEEIDAVPKAVHAARTAASLGHADWVAFLAIVHCLGGVAARWNWDATGGSPAPVDASAAGSVTWLADVQADLSAFLTEEEHSLFEAGANAGAMAEEPHNPVARDPLQPVWSGNEYLFHVLSKNEASLPSVAADMVRLVGMAPLLAAEAYPPRVWSLDEPTLRWVNLFAQVCGQVESEWAQGIDCRTPSQHEIDRVRNLTNKFCFEPWAW
mmetsp:Transcript_25797/g.73067  ORF Transcript_25797/g.73067 Transcript_25797/m.73067 type:complete len:393 (+) Transcript_25797:34-1212(+)